MSGNGRIGRRRLVLAGVLGALLLASMGVDVVVADRSGSGLIVHVVVGVAAGEGTSGREG